MKAYEVFVVAVTFVAGIVTALVAFPGGWLLRLVLFAYMANALRVFVANLALFEFWGGVGGGVGGRAADVGLRSIAAAGYVSAVVGIASAGESFIGKHPQLVLGATVVVTGGAFLGWGLFFGKRYRQAAVAAAGDGSNHFASAA